MRPAVAPTPQARQALVGKYRIAGLGDVDVAERGGQLMIALRPGQWEPLYAASDKLLFVLSRKAELGSIDANSGHPIVGSSSKSCSRISGPW